MYPKHVIIAFSDADADDDGVLFVTGKHGAWELNWGFFNYYMCSTRSAIDMSLRRRRAFDYTNLRIYTGYINYIDLSEL